MKRWLVCGALVGWAWLACAHVGNQNIVFEGRAGASPVRVIIRPPMAVPGLAEITVRSLDGRADRVTALPLYWRLGREGAPRPDEAVRVPGETNLFQARLWLMTPGAYSVEVGVHGPAGEGVVLVPINSIATSRLGLPRLMAAALAGMGLVLFAGAASIAGAAAREGVLPPGIVVTARRARLGWAAAVLAVGVLALALHGGNRWWDSVDAHHTDRILFKPPPTTARVADEGGESRLQLEVDSAWQRLTAAPLIPDHGRMMHLFLVRDAGPLVFAHLHPARLEGGRFEVPLPPLPEGRYRFFADVVYESGLAVTLTNAFELAKPSPHPPEDTTEDATWLIGEPLPVGSVRETGDGIGIQLEAGPVTAGEATSLRARVRRADHAPATLQPWLGMLGHAVLMREDGTVFSHLHPAGTISMASQRRFTEREFGAAAARIDPNCGDLEALPPAVVEALGRGGEVAFPYVFAEPGDYRVWVQVKVAGKVHTAAFALKVVARAET